MQFQSSFVIIGGGIAGVTCAETLAFLEPMKPIILISESNLIKTVVNLHAITQTLSNFDIKEQPATFLSEKYKNITVIHDKLVGIISAESVIKLESSNTVKYQYLCLCMGGKPKILPQAALSPQIFYIRDVDSVQTFLDKLKSSKCVVVIGNGGIASELVYKMTNIEVHWVIKDAHISATFIDPGAAEFLRDKLGQGGAKTDQQGPQKRMRFEADEAQVRKSGAALGPDWYKSLDIKGGLDEVFGDAATVHYQCEVTEVQNEGEGFPVTVILNDGSRIGCDFVVSATGAEANTDFVIDVPLKAEPQLGILVDEHMQTSTTNIFAAGDICHPNWAPQSPQWFPMKLWTQARQMGCYAAKVMSSFSNSEEILQDFCFELFTHTTNLFGYKVVLLGLYNGQSLGSDYEIIFRMTKNEEYIKLVLKDGRLQGAVLLGETDLEEMCENLILNKIDLSDFKEDLLNPNVDIEDYFD